MSAGRPALFETPQELQGKIDEYFQSCESFINDMGDLVPGKPITVTGLAYFLGFESRQSLYDYKEREEFSYIIKRAKLRVEQAYEEKLSYQNAAGTIFALKNMGWSDKQEIEQSSTIKDERGDLSKLTDEELELYSKLNDKCRVGKEKV